MGECHELQDGHVKIRFKIKKRLLVECDRFFICGKTGIPTGPDKIMIHDARTSKYSAHLGRLYVDTNQKIQTEN